MNADNISPEIMPGRWLEHASRVLQQIRHCRYYAMPYSALRAIAAELAVWQKDRSERLHESFDDKAAATFLAEVLPLIAPGAIQSWRPGDEPKTPQLWKDEVTGEVPKNPWAKG